MRSGSLRSGSLPQTHEQYAGHREGTPLLDTIMRNEVAEMMETRSHVYQTLARLWIAEVDETLLRGLKDAAFPALPEAPTLDSAYRRLEGYLQGTDAGTLRVLAADYSLLCRGTNPVKGADPYESVHRNPLGLMMQDEWEEVLRFYRAVGLKRSESSVEPEDHLGIELECMARLCQRFTKAYGQNDEVACLDSLRMQRKMLGAHLLLWVSHFTKEVLTVANTEFYKSVATITAEYLVMDFEYVCSILPSVNQTGFWSG
jgi:TorA maturation chaperone TorD